MVCHLSEQFFLSRLLITFLAEWKERRPVALHVYRGCSGTQETEGNVLHVWEVEAWFRSRMQNCDVLGCETEMARGKRWVKCLNCTIFKKYKERISGRRNYSERWISGADSPRTSNISDHAHSDQFTSCASNMCSIQYLTHRKSTFHDPWHDPRYVHAPITFTH